MENKPIIRNFEELSIKLLQRTRDLRKEELEVLYKQILSKRNKKSIPLVEKCQMLLFPVEGYTNGDND